MKSYRFQTNEMFMYQMFSKATLMFQKQEHFVSVLRGLLLMRTKV